jgi:predicted nucleic acid-binding protein
VQLLISDANILIDLEEGELIKHLFQLPYDFSTPDILFYEELENEHEYLLSLGLQLNELSSETMLYAVELTSKYQRPSRNDCFALALAAQEKCPLLTGDKDLKNAAINESIMVRGTLWLVEMMIQRKLITIEDARESFKKMKATGRRLPWRIADAMLQELQNEPPT